MSYSRAKIAGVLFFVAATQFVLCLIIAESLFPGYSVSGNYVSDLGIGSSSIVFNSSVIFLGVLLLGGTHFLRNVSDFKILNLFLFLMAVGSIGVGVFTEDFRTVHGVVSSMAFFFAGLSALLSFRFLEKPFSLISVILGAMTLGALSFFSIGLVASGSLTSIEAYDSVFFLGLGPGGMERMIVYPALMWLAGFGGYLLTKPEE